MMKYFVYILYSLSLDRYYAGSTENVEDRLKKHLASHKGFTGKAKDWQVKLIEEFNSKTDALKRERQLKRWKSRASIEQLIKTSVRS
jgi:putative endonuclease